MELLVIFLSAGLLVLEVCSVIAWIHARGRVVQAGTVQAQNTEERRERNTAEGGKSAGGHTGASAQADVEAVDHAAAAAALAAEEVKLKERLETLRREAELAEREWAAAVLKERTARMHAERFAQEFARVRRSMEAQMRPKPPGAARREIPAAMSCQEAFRVLKLAPGCTLDEVREAYRRQVTRYHPDKVSIFGSQIVETAERETKRLNLAYAVARKALGG